MRRKRENAAKYAKNAKSGALAGGLESLKFGLTQHWTKVEIVCLMSKVRFPLRRSL